jgi:hypothetical protein
MLMEIKEKGAGENFECEGEGERNGRVVTVK